MRPLIVLNGLGTGGAERSTAEFLEHIRRSCGGVSPTVACLYRRHQGVQDAVIRQGFDVRFLRGRGRTAKIWALRSLIADLEPDLVHTAIFEADITGRLAALGGPPVLSSLVNASYDPVRLQDPNIKPRRLEAVRKLDASTARWLTTHFHAVSHTVKASAISHLSIPPERITVIERGRDAQRLGQPHPQRRARVREALGIAQDTPVLICVGRQEYQKGHKYLLMALQQITDVYQAAVLLLVGREGNASHELNTILKDSGVSRHVRMLGSRDDVPDLLASADVFVLPSMYEGLPGAVIEAMALGLPVVATNLSSVQEVVEHEQTALLVQPRSPESLARAVVAILRDPELGRTLGCHSREVFFSRFTGERAHNRMLSLYMKIAELGRQHRA